jgi:Flp pilus assembly protein TadB
MAQTKKKRRRKHRGTQAGNIERPGRTGRPSSSRGPAGAKAGSKADARATAAQRREERFNREPTWRSAFNRSAFAAVILAIFVAVVQKNVAAGVVLGLLALVLYLPLSYFMDRALWRRRQRTKQQQGKPRSR